MSSNTITPNSASSVKVSIQNAVSQNSISAQTADDILEQLDNIAIAGAMGVDPDDIDSEEITLISVAIDASGSMSGERDTVIDAYNNHFLKALRGAKNAESIHIALWVFSDLDNNPDNYCRLVHGYVPATQALELNDTIYSPDGMTPLNMAVHRCMSGIVAYGQQLRDEGTNTKCAIVVFSDGYENSSGRNFSDARISRMSEDLLRQEIYILSYCYFGPETEAQAMAERIGFPERHSIAVDKTDHDIRDVFGQASSSLVSVSQNQVSATSLSSNAFLQTNRRNLSI